MEDDPILLQILEDSPDIQAAEERYRRFLSDPVLRNQYRQRDKNLRDYNNRMGAAREEGLAAGREEGREEGSRTKARAIAAGLKAAGVATETIASTTGLSLEEIADL